MSLTAKTLVMCIITVLSVAGEDCGDVQEGKEVGMVRLPDFTGEVVENLNCYWTYTAPLDRKLLIKVDNVHLPPSEIRNSSLQLYVDDQFFEIPRNCVKCLREMVGGKTVKVIFLSSIVPSAHSVLQNSTTDSLFSTEGIGSFQIRFKAFDPNRCNRPKSPENGYIIGKDRKLGQEIIYKCNPPYDLVGISKASCVIPENTPVPDWTSKAPRCIIKDCSKGTILRKAGSGAIANPGYPSYAFQSTSCQWEITAELNQQIKISLTYLVFTVNDGKSGNSFSYLSFLDSDQKNIIANLTEGQVGEPLNFTTRSNKLIVQFVVTENKTKGEAGFYLEYSTIPSSCPDPGPPLNGELVAYSRELGSTVAYRCLPGYILVGDPHSDCMPSGQWSNPKPTCELLSVHSEPFLAASNDTDTVSGNITELTLLPSPSKPPLHTKKKAKDPQILKLSIKPSVDRKDKAVVPKEDFSSVKPLPEAITVDVSSSRERKKNDKDDGPRSQPHLQQVVPSKDVVKKVGEPRDKLPGLETVNNVTFRLPSPPVGQETREGKGRRGLSVTLIAIIAGVGAPFGVGLVLLVALLIYRKRYPVRMRFGRKFSTFENPMYVRKDAHHPRELKPLTT